MPERNPFEETRQAAQDWSPREQYISRSNQDRAYDATVNRIIQESQGNQQRWEQGGGQGAYPVFNEPGTGANYPVSPGWLKASSGRDNSGIMAVDARNIFNLQNDWTGIKLAAANNAGGKQMMDYYNTLPPYYDAFINTDPIEPHSIESRENLRKFLLNKVFKKYWRGQEGERGQMSEEDKYQMKLLGYDVDAGMNYNFRTGLPEEPKPGFLNAYWSPIYENEGDDLRLGIEATWRN